MYAENGLSHNDSLENVENIFYELRLQNILDSDQLNVEIYENLMMVSAVCLGYF